MLPDHPPFPTARNLPFQSVAGSHTSILMSESLDGASVAATRQNGGRSAYARALPPAAPAPGAAGGTKPPAATNAAAVMDVLGSFSSRSRSHAVSAPAAVRANNAIATIDAVRRIVRVIVRGSYDNRAMRVALFFIAAVVALSIVSAAPSSAVDPALLSQLQWRGIGPAATGGRIDDFAVARGPGAPDTIYVATAAGGVFRSTNQATS